MMGNHITLEVVEEEGNVLHNDIQESKDDLQYFLNNLNSLSQYVPYTFQQVIFL